MQSGTDPSTDCVAERESAIPIVLCVGNDEPLLSYRCKVLAQAGFRVVPARPQHDQVRQFVNLCRLHSPAMVIACHTLSPQQRIALAQELRDVCPGVQLLALTNGDLTASEAAGYDLQLDSLDGPAALIQQVRARV